MVAGGSPGVSDSLPLLANPADDLDGDGYSALLEYALGTSDVEADSHPPLRLEYSVSEQQVFLEYHRNLQSDGVEILIERSTDLVTWQRTEGLGLDSREKTDANTEKLRFGTITTPANARYYRLKISRP